jgi:hypothetical protein
MKSKALVIAAAGLLTMSGAAFAQNAASPENYGSNAANGNNASNSTQGGQNAASDNSHHRQA